jgi:hypothetical protein
MIFQESVPVTSRKQLDMIRERIATGTSKVWRNEAPLLTVSSPYGAIMRTL